MELITVIVPIYNSEYYLEECLDSLQRQSYQNIEIILINDGSTDGSADICRRYCEGDSRFVLIEQNNKGLPLARNAGLDIASGDYICFVDSDDYVDEKFIEILYRNIKAFCADISICGYIKFEGEGCYMPRKTNMPRNIDKLEMIQKLATVGPGNQSEEIVICCNKMINNAIFQGLRFPDKLHEDEFIINDYILRMGKAVYTDAKLYYYRQHTTSITGDKKNMRHMEALEAVRRRVEIFRTKEYESVFKDILYSYFENAVIMYFKLLERGKGYELKKKIYPQYINILLHNRKELGIRKLLRYVLFLISPGLFRRRYWT